MTAITADADPIVVGTAPESWEDAPRRPPASAAPVLTVAGFEGPLDWLLDLARAQRIDLAKLSIVALVDAFVTALDTALREPAARADLSRWGEWLVMAATLALLRSRLLLPPGAPKPGRRRTRRRRWAASCSSAPRSARRPSGWTAEINSGATCSGAAVWPAWPQGPAA